MIRRFSCLIFFLSFIAIPLYSQEETVLNSTLLRADKLFINRRYEEAVQVYLKYLEKFPRDYYAERQTAICFDKLNKPDDAIDHWPLVVESSEATEKDYFDYGKSLLVNNRIPQAKKVFAMLSKSKDKSLAAWGRAYINPAALYIDSASVKILEVKGLNTEVSESSPFVFQDKFYYVSEMMRLPRTYYTLNDDETQHIGGALKRDSLFLYPSILNERLHVLPIRGPFCFSPDGSVLYFCRPVSSRELQVKSKEPFFKYQLYTLTMSTLNDLQPEIKPFRYNRPEFNFMHPCISGDGKHLYFSSDMKGSAGGMDIFVSEWTSNGWSAPVNAGSQINTAGNEVFPSLAGNNGLYFSSDHLPGLGGLDIFYAAPSANKDLRFEEAENVGAYMNSRFDDFGVYSDKAGRGYFSSNRKNNTDDDIYYFFRIK